MFPIELVKEEISKLREAGMFKSYSNKSDEFVTELSIGRAICLQDGWANSSQYWNSETNEVDPLEILRLDFDKVWILLIGFFYTQKSTSYLHKS